MAMAIDLLKLDRELAMPTYLRRKWKLEKRYDPLCEARKNRDWGLIWPLGALVGCGLCFSVVLFGPSITRLIAGVIIATISLVLGGAVWKKTGAKADKFVDELVNLACALEVSVYELYEYSFRELRKLANDIMLSKATQLLSAEDEYAKLHQEPESDRASIDLKADEVENIRDRLSKTHARLYSWNLVEDQWNSYFDQAKQSRQAIEALEQSTGS